MKKIISIVLVLALALSIFGGCVAETKVDPNAKKKIGIISMSAVQSPTFKATTLAMEAVAEAAGVELIKVELTSYGDEGFLAAYETMISQGVDAAMLYTFSEAVIPLVTDMMETADVSYFLTNRKINNEEMKADIFDNENMVGNDYCNEKQVGYDMVEYLHSEFGSKNLAVIGLAKGDVNGDMRDAGIQAACDELGINLLVETRGVTTVEDVTNAVNGFAGAYSEMDSILIVGGAVTPGGLAGVNQALINNKLDDKVNVAMIDIATGMGEYMDDGPLKIVAGGNLIFDQVLSMIALVNEVKGTPLSSDPYIIDTKMLYVTSSQEAEDYEQYVESLTVPIFTVEELKKEFLKFENADVTLESIQKIIDEFTIAGLKERRNG